MPPSSDTSNLEHGSDLLSPPVVLLIDDDPAHLRALEASLARTENASSATAGTSALEPEFMLVSAGSAAEALRLMKVMRGG